MGTRESDFDSSPAPVKAGDVLAGKYAVDRVLGVGGMGVVVAAHHVGLGSRVAVKFLLPGLAASGEVVARFLREAQAVAQLSSEHVARVSDVGTLESGAPYMVMEYLDGKDLSAVLHERGPLPVDEAADYLLQACQAIAEAHAKGIVHRDLKPSNLFLTMRPDRTALVKVLDFGIAKSAGAEMEQNVALTDTRAMMGSPLYASPEQLRSARRVDSRTDVWSLGVTLHELLTGKYPFDAENVTGLIATIIADPPVKLRAHRPDAPEALERLVLRCLEKDPAARLPSVGAFAEALAPFGTEDAILSLSRISRVSKASSRPGADALSASGSARAQTPGSAARGADTHATFGTTQSRDSTRSSMRLLLAAVVALGFGVAASVWFRSPPAPAAGSPSAASLPSLPEHAPIVAPPLPPPSPVNVAPEVAAAAVPVVSAPPLAPAPALREVSRAAPRASGAPPSAKMPDPTPPRAPPASGDVRSLVEERR